MNPREAYEYNGDIIMYVERYYCWCILDDKGDKVREPYWGTTCEAREAIDRGEAL